MNIKTITSTDGVNEVDFGSSASRFYWFQNIGTTTVHVSGNADIVAGGDGVAELAAGDSVCIEALGGKVYVLGAGKVQIHNTGDKFCPFKNAPAQSGGEAVDAYTKSESDAKYAQKTDIPSSLPANGGNADYATNAGNADTVDNLHADDFVNATDFNNYQIPNNTDVPAWIHENGKRYQLYMTNGANIGMTNVPNDSTDYVWYWFDGTNIFAREWAAGKYYICDVINGSFSGWKDVYTSGYKPYVTGMVVVDSNGKANVSFGFNPSFVLYAPTSPKSGIFGSVYSARVFNATGFTPSADTYTGGLTGSGLDYIAFK